MIPSAITPAKTLATKEAAISSKMAIRPMANNTTAPTMTICAIVAPNMTNMRRSIFLSTKASVIIATITRTAIRAAPHNEISFTIYILFFVHIHISFAKIHIF